MLAFRHVLKDFDEDKHPRDSNGRFAVTQSDLNEMGHKGKAALAKRLNLNLPTHPTRHEVSQALERVARTSPKKLSPVKKAYVSQAQRNLMEACRADPNYSENCPPPDVVAEFHEASRGGMKDKDLPEKTGEKEKKKSRKAFIQL